MNASPHTQRHVRQEREGEGLHDSLNTSKAISTFCGNIRAHVTTQTRAESASCHFASTASVAACNWAIKLAIHLCKHTPPHGHTHTHTHSYKTTWCVHITHTPTPKAAADELVSSLTCIGPFAKPQVPCPSLLQWPSLQVSAQGRSCPQCCFAAASQTTLKADFVQS